MDIVNNIILFNFSRKVKFHINQFNNYKSQLYLLKTIYWNMVTNLTELNFMTFYKDYNFYYIDILNKMNLLKDELYIVPSFTNFKFYKINKLTKYVIEIQNFIAPKNLNLILNFYNNDWSNYFSNEENVQLLFLIDFIRPISIFNLNNGIVINNETVINKETEINIFTKSNDEEENIIDNNYSKDGCISILNDKNLVLQKNKKAISLLENKYGCSIYIKLDDLYLVVQGIFKDDLFNMAIKNPYVKNIFEAHINNIQTNLTDISSSFSISYFNTINLRDKLVCLTDELCLDIKKKYNDLENIQSKQLILLINEFILGSKYRKIDILTLLLISNNDDNKLAHILFDVLKTKDKKNITIEIYNALHYSIRHKLDIATQNNENEEKQINFDITDITYEKRISLLKTNNDIKMKATEKLKLIKNNFQGDPKAQNWLDGLLKIPFNIYNENSIVIFKKKFINKLGLNLISDNDIELELKNRNDNNLSKEWLDYKIEKQNYLINIRQILDKSIYGHKEAKTQLERIFAQWINGKNGGAILGLHGPPGVGKTALIKKGLAQCLKDSNGQCHPFAFIPIGGSVNGSTLVGHNYTYVGSIWGRIVDILISSKCMNPIIFIDELDKISNTEQGHEIISILTHLTDPTQNNEFEDKFFAGIKLDLSKALIIFSFNDLSLIDYILKDRITIIETPALKLKDKIIIIKNYILPEVCIEIGFNSNEIILEDTLIEYLISTYTMEAGVRKIKEKIIDIVREINFNKIFYDSITIPYIVTKDFCDKLFELKLKIKPKKILNQSTVGIVNGLYANSASLGGITFIQAIKFPSNKLLDLNITGSIGAIMKESISYSLRLAFNLLPDKIQNKIIKNPFGIHLHCPDGATKKDGPSAGVAITLALYSLLINKPVNNKIALTGEIDLLGNITAIGGLEIKLIGAQLSGIEIVLFPEENLEDIEIIKKENNLEDNNFKIIAVNNIKQVLALCLIK